MRNFHRFLLVSSILSGLLIPGAQAFDVIGVQPPGSVPVVASADANNQLIVGAGGYTATATVVPAVTAALYATGNCLGTTQSISGLTRSGSSPVGPNTLTITATVITDKDAQNAPIDLVFFNTAPAGTYTDHAACGVVYATDGPKVAGVIHVTDWSTATIGLGQNLSSPPLTIALAAGQPVTFQAIVRGAPTYTAVNSITVRLTAYQD